MAKKRSATKELTLDEKISKALSHPLRGRILSVLNDRIASPSELEELFKKEGLSNIAYHVKVLERLDCVEPVGSKRVRGAVKTQYRGLTRMMLDDRAWRKLEESTRGGISTAAVNEVIDRARRAMEAGTFDSRTDRHVITVNPDLDELGWSQVAKIVADAFHAVQEVAGEVANRQTDPSERFRATVSFLSYEAPTTPGLPSVEPPDMPGSVTWLCSFGCGAEVTALPDPDSEDEEFRATHDGWWSHGPTHLCPLHRPQPLDSRLGGGA
jgi:DNA-binding transcriptional ArsR family regulator